MEKVIIDTNLYIDWINIGKYAEIILGRGWVKYLSGIVLLELYTGAFETKDIKLIDRLWRTFNKAKRIVLPTVSDYREAGQLLARLQANHGYDLKKAYTLANDVLIALSARRLGAAVITKNRRDFEAIQRLVEFRLITVP